MSFDFDSLSGLAAAQETGKDVEIAHPKTGDPTGVVVRVAGPDSDRQKAGVAAMVQDRIENNIRKLTPARQTYEANLLAAHSVISWSGVVVKGEVISFSIETAIKIFAQAPWMREQIQRVSDDRANFI